MFKVLLAGLLLVATPVAAQLPTSSVRGTVTDSQSAVLPGATVTLTHVETGLKRVATTNQQGEYRVAALPSGVYDIVVELSGFEKQTRRVEVLLNQEVHCPTWSKPGCLAEAPLPGPQAYSTGGLSQGSDLRPYLLGEPLMKLVGRLVGHARLDVPEQ